MFAFAVCVMVREVAGRATERKGRVESRVAKPKHNSKNGTHHHDGDWTFYFTLHLSRARDGLLDATGTHRLARRAMV
jgi:hypothetical protein